MKNRTSDFRPKLKEEIDKHQSIQVRFGNSNMYIPRKIMHVFERNFNHYEAECIDDIKENYNTLTVYSKIPLSLIYWSIKTILPLYLHDEEFMAIPNEVFQIEHKELSMLSNPSGREFRANFNIGYLFNVSVQNFEFTKRRTFELCEFDILDRKDNSMRGVLQYHSVPSTGAHDIARGQLEQVVNSSLTDHFDIVFSAMPEKYLIHKEEYTREKKLRVFDIRKRKTESEETEDVPVDFTSLTPVLVR
jgi:hypothetical protein